MTEKNAFSLSVRFLNHRLITKAHLHLVLLFWNHVLTCASVILSAFAKAALSAEARYFWRWKRFSSSQIWRRVNDVLGFFFFGGVRFWYGWPIRRVTVNGERATGLRNRVKASGRNQQNDRAKQWRANKASRGGRYISFFKTTCNNQKY